MPVEKVKELFQECLQKIWWVKNLVICQKFGHFLPTLFTDKVFYSKTRFSIH